MPAPGAKTPSELAAAHSVTLWSCCYALVGHALAWDVQDQSSVPLGPQSFRVFLFLGSWVNVSAAPEFLHHTGEDGQWIHRDISIPTLTCLALNILYMLKYEICPFSFSGTPLQSTCIDTFQSWSAWAIFTQRVKPPFSLRVTNEEM